MSSTTHSAQQSASPGLSTLKSAPVTPKGAPVTPKGAPVSADGLLVDGVLLYEAGDVHRALARWREVLVIDPAHTVASRYTQFVETHFQVSPSSSPRRCRRRRSGSAAAWWASPPPPRRRCW